MSLRTECRIGNFLKASAYYDTEDAKDDLRETYSEENEWKTVRVDGICHELENYSFWLDAIEFEANRIEPIPLTEEWLISLGAKRFSNDFAIHGVIIHKRKRGWVINKKVPIQEHVHQLQNLIFALTGIELHRKDGH